MRILYIILANISLPFLLFYLRNVLYLIYYRYILKDKTKKAPSLDLKLALKLVFCGILLLASILFYFRLTEGYQDRGQFYKVKQQNLR